MTWWIAQNVVVTAALALVVAVACRLLRAGPVARHALWVLVLIKFITPPLVVWPWALPDPIGLSVESRAIERAPIADASSRSLKELIPTEYQFVPSNPDGAVLLQRRAAESTPFDPTWWLLGIWISGSVFLVGLEGLRVWRLHRRVSTGSAPDEALDDRVRDLARSLSVPDVRVRVVDGISSPMIWAAGRPQLLWPADLPPDSSDACIDGLIVHELAHIRRRDHVIGWIELAAGVVWWWNPLFWFVRASRREQAELACDAWVISVLPNGRRAYAESLLALSGGAVRGAPSMAVVGIRATSRRVLERRLVMIMKGSTPLRLPVMGIAGLAFAAAMTLPAWAMSSQPQVATVAPQTQAPPPPPPVTVPPTAAQSARRTPQPTIAVVVEPATTAPVPVAVAVTVPAPNPSPQVKVQPTIAVAPQLAVPSRSMSAAAQQATPPPPPPPAPAVTATYPPRVVKRSESVALVPKREVAALPAEGQKLLTQFDADRDQMQKDLASRIEARRQDLIKQLAALQEQYTKAGKLDEAIAVRNYLRVLTGGREPRAR